MSDDPELQPERLRELLATAEQVARAAGRVLEEFQARAERPETLFKGRRELVTAADKAAERTVVQALLERHPDHGVLAEEGVLTPQGQASRAGDFLWIVDPLDGTTNFVHRIPFYCVAVALAWRGTPVLGVVHAPALDRTYTAARGTGAFCNGRPIRVTATADLRHALLATGFSYDRNEPGHDTNQERLGRALLECRDLRRLGSAELDLCLVADGAFDGYWELYLQPYDVAAGAVVVREAGGRVTDLNGGDDWLYGRHVAASNGALHEALLGVVGPR